MILHWIIRIFKDHVALAISREGALVCNITERKKKENSLGWELLETMTMIKYTQHLFKAWHFILL